MVTFTNIFRRSRISNTIIFPREKADLEAIKQHQDYIKHYPCPNCSELKLTLTKHVQGKLGWETQVLCNHCKADIIMDSTGLHVNLSGVPEREVKQ